MNRSGISAFNQARIEWAIRLKYSPMPNLDMEKVAGWLNDFRIGELRQVGKMWEVMLERDGELAVNSDKRKSDAAGLDWQVVSDGSLDGDRHAEALQYFYDNLTATKALDQDSTGGVDELIYQTCSALDSYYSAHEILLRVDNPAAREVTAEFRHTPIWFMEARRGYLGYLQHIFDVYGQPCLQGEWLTAVNVGWMRQCSIIYTLKAFALRDWGVFNARYGSGFLVGKTKATQGDPQWEQALAALDGLANDGAVLVNEEVSFEFLAQAARNGIPFEPMVEWCNSLYAKCYRGVDLATGSRGAKSGGDGGGKSPVGASVQKEESGIFLVRDAKWLTGVFNERIDRPIIRYLFGQEPRAWFALMPPIDDTSAEDLQALQALVPMGLRVALKEVYKRFRWSVPDADEPCLTPPAPVSPVGSSEMEDENGDFPSEKLPGVKSAPPTPEPKPAEQDGKTQPAMATDTTPIGVGADPARNPGLANPGHSAYAQTASRQMPDPQVDAAAGWSRNGLVTPRSDGQTLPAPSLGYALPNAVDQLAFLTQRGLGQSRAARALQRSLRVHQQTAARLALENEQADPDKLTAKIQALIEPALVAAFIEGVQGKRRGDAKS